MPNAFEQHARANGSAVATPSPPDAPTPGDGASSSWEQIRSGNQTRQPASRINYQNDGGMPGMVSSPLYHITVNEDTAGILEGQSGRTDEINGNDTSVDITRYIDRNIGGSTGVRIVNGWTSGLSTGTWNAHHFKGRAVQLVPAQPASIRPGPVGRINYGGNLAAGVASQFEVPPSLEDIYRSIVNRGPA